jgi:hypothetical protein
MPTTQQLPPDLAAALATRAAAVTDAERALGRARDRLDSAIYDAVRRHDCQVAAVAAAAGVSRETAYKAAGRFDPQLRIS